jgi:hypothetical protein
LFRAHTKFENFFSFPDRRSKLQIIDNTLSITLKPNNTVVIAAKLNAEVSAKTW